jgi:adenosylcobinamide amidohydrolase
MLNALKSVPFDDPEYHYFSPEDLAAMRHAYYTASMQRPIAVQTHLQRMTLAKAILVVFDSTLSESAMIDAAWLIVSDAYA